MVIELLLSLLHTHTHTHTHTHAYIHRFFTSECSGTLCMVIELLLSLLRTHTHTHTHACTYIHTFLTSACSGTFCMVIELLLSLLLPQNVTPLTSIKCGSPRATNCMYVCIHVCEGNRSHIHTYACMYVCVCCVCVCVCVKLFADYYFECWPRKRDSRADFPFSTRRLGKFHMNSKRW
jgi:hypothetical protein